MGARLVRMDALASSGEAEVRLPPGAGVRQASPAPQCGSVGGLFPGALYGQNAANWTVFDPERAINTAELTIANRVKRSLQARRSSTRRARRRTRFHTARSARRPPALSFAESASAPVPEPGPPGSSRDGLGGDEVARPTTTDEDPLTSSPPGSRRDLPAQASRLILI